ncbi:MAG: helix-turn-helix domain-containing protein [Kiritimatiellia bacterium]|nr:helix-turn-helix domain-containing protein [Lentisphaerota bacterium]
MESIGQTLKAARECSNFSVADVATAIKAKKSFVNAIETDRFNDLIAPVYAKGFIKLYAEHVGLDPGPLLQLYNEAPNAGNRVGRPPLAAAAPAAPPVDIPGTPTAQTQAPLSAPPPASNPAAPPPPCVPEKVSPINWRALLPQCDFTARWHAVRDRIGPFIRNLTSRRSSLRGMLLQLRHHYATPQLRLLACALIAGAALLVLVAGLWQRHAERCAQYAPPAHYGILMAPPEPYPE